mmetsp:Transcript_23150/g.64374  ORF Transcript_23150/g.64374 Transcript_23150/m.64374 type:complete len:283 (+) Transcript_23150:828-1676(+)
MDQAEVDPERLDDLKLVVQSLGIERACKVLKWSPSGNDKVENLCCDIQLAKSLVDCSTGGDLQFQTEEERPIKNMSGKEREWRYHVYLTEAERLRPLVKLVFSSKFPRAGDFGHVPGQRTCTYRKLKQHDLDQEQNMVVVTLWGKFLTANLQASFHGTVELPSFAGTAVRINNTQYCGDGGIKHDHDVDHVGYKEAETKTHKKLAYSIAEQSGWYNIYGDFRFEAELQELDRSVFHGNIFTGTPMESCIINAVHKLHEDDRGPLSAEDFEEVVKTVKKKMAG